MSLAWIETLVRGAGGLLALAVLGVIFYGIWRGAARPIGRQVGRFPTWLHSPVFFLLTSAAYFGVCIWLWRPLPLVLGPVARVTALVGGSLLYFLGLGGALWGRLALGQMYFVSTGLGAQLFADHRLVTHGPFAYVRHPMYAGLAAATLGGLLLYQTWTLVVMLLLPLGLLRRAWREEQALAAQFGQPWRDYCRRVPAFVPRLRRAGGGAGAGGPEMA